MRFGRWIGLTAAAAALLFGGWAQAGQVVDLIGDKDNSGSETAEDIANGLDSYSSNYQGRSWTFNYDIPAGEEAVSAVVTINAALLSSEPDSFALSYNGQPYGTIFDSVNNDGELRPITFAVAAASLTGQDTVTLQRIKPETDSFFLGGSVDYLELVVTTQPIPTPATGVLLLPMLAGLVLRRRGGRAE